MDPGTRGVLRWAGPLVAVSAAFLTACPGFLVGGRGPQATSSPVSGTGSPAPEKTAGPLTGTTEPAPNASPSGSSASPSPTPAASASPKILSVKIEPATATLGVKPRTGATPVRAIAAQLTPVVVLETGATYSAVVWTSSNPAMVTVDGKGLVTAGTATGSAVVSLKIGTLEATAGVAVVDLGGAGVTIQ